MMTYICKKKKMRYSEVIRVGCLVVLLTCACGTQDAPQAQTRGVGIYPGRPDESAAPSLTKGGRIYRNLALGRAAKHSSSCDFNLTAQLATDGIVQDDNSTFQSVWKSAGEEGEWISVDLGATSRVDRMVFHWANAPVSGSILCSKDERHWKEIGKVAKGESFAEVRLPKTNARYFKAVLDRTDNGEPFALSEWEVWGHGGVMVVPKEASLRTGSRQDLSGGEWRLRRSSEVKDAGETVSSAAYEPDGWIPATVPGTVLASYVNAGCVPDPNYADNQLFISESYFHSDFWYRDTFEARIDSDRQFLHFDGVNWKAEVFLNGLFLGKVAGAYQETVFDVTGLLKEGRNDLAVRVICNEHFGQVTVQDAFNSGSNGGLLGADNPTMHATVGWDWLPTVRGRNVGIYDDVYLSYTGPVTLEDPFIRTDLPLPDTSYADILSQVRLVNHSDTSVSGVLKVSFGDLETKQEASLAAGEDRLVDLGVMRLEHPQLWWPNGYGKQPLYDVTVSFETEKGLSDQTSFKTGIREMSYDFDTCSPGRDGSTDRLNIFVNGKRFVGFGGNWGFPEHLMNYRAREYDAAVRYHADMHFTMIRNWVGQICDKEFYEACDKYGILVWQDFWLANPYDGPDPYDESRFVETARQYVRRIRNHPSIGIYFGRNEGNPPAAIDAFLTAMVPEEHPGIAYLPHSSEGPVSGGGPYRALPVSDYYTLFGADKFHSERGMPAVMDYENLVRSLGTENVEPYSSVAHPNAMYGLHDYTLGGGQGVSSAQRADTFNAMLVNAFGEPADARQFTEWAQWITYDGYRGIFEGRIAHRQGLLLWMSHPAWPSLVWQTYDYFLEPTAAYFGCKKACEPVHIQLNPLNDVVEAVSWYAQTGGRLTVQAEILGLDGKPLWNRSEDIDLGTDETQSLFPVEFPEDRPDVCFVRLRLVDTAGRTVSENLYWRGKEDLKALKDIEPAQLTCSLKRSSTDEETILELTLENTGETPALMLRLKAVDSADGDLIVPVLYSDNYFFLMPGETKPVTVRLRNEDIAGRAELSLSGFNVKKIPVK